MIQNKPQFQNAQKTPDSITTKINKQNPKQIKFKLQKMKEKFLNEPGKRKLRNTLLIEEHESITDEFLETMQE